MFHFGNFLGFTYYIIYSHGAKLIIIFHLCKFLYAQYEPYARAKRGYKGSNYMADYFKASMISLNGREVGL